MIVFDIRRMPESSEVECGGAAASIESINSSAAGSPEEGEGGDATLKEDPTLGCLKLAHI